MAVNRTDRLYALVEELRAVAPRPRTARQLSERFEVSVRTVERDLNALMQAGVPLYATPGPGGGYAIDKGMTLPPVNFSPAEATAIAVALARPGATPFTVASRSARQKVVAAMRAADAVAAEALTDRVRLMDSDRPPPALAGVIEEAMLRRRVTRISYIDRTGEVTERDVEPVAFVGAGRNWYLVGWCRLRADGRSFRLDRITDAVVTDEAAEDRSIDALTAHFPNQLTRPPLLE